jgi:hypothetical protein
MVTKAEEQVQVNRLTTIVPMPQRHPAKGSEPAEELFPAYPHYEVIVGVPTDTVTGIVFHAIFVDSNRGADFARFREQIRSFEHLPERWDTYNAKPLSRIAVRNALNLLDRLEEASIVPDMVLPTSDNSIFIRFKNGDHIFEYELFSDGESAKVKIDSKGRHEYSDVSIEELNAAL